MRECMWKQKPMLAAMHCLMCSTPTLIFLMWVAHSLLAIQQAIQLAD